MKLLRWVMEEFLYKELSYEVIGCAFEAFKTVGVGFNELIYHKYFHDQLLEKGMSAKYRNLNSILLKLTIG
jgi:hypothetical protein